MIEQPNFDSDSDDGEEELDSVPAVDKNNLTWHLKDIEKLKEQTTELLDSKWKETRNHHLLSKMLDLEQPAITAKMVDFLLQDGVIETLLGFITLNGTGLPRPSPSDGNTPSLKKAYRAVILLSPESPSDALNALITKKASIITKKIFEIFWNDSAGSFYHAYRILECLLRCYPTEVFEGLCSDGLMSERISDMLRYVGFAPVCEMLVMLIALTPIARGTPQYTMCSKARWVFIDELTNFNVMLYICKVISDPMQYCEVDSYINADQHASAAGQLFLELVEKLSLEESGEVLLQPVGHFPSVIDSLIDTTVGHREDAVAEMDGLRRSAARMICFLLRRAADSEIVCYTMQPNGAPPTTTCVPNRLFEFRGNIVDHVRYRMADIMSFLMGFDSLNHSTKDPIKFSSYEVARPFSALRALVIEIIALMVESEETVASLISVELWKLLIVWSVKYAHNNIYHALFYRLVFAVLRQGQEASQRILFQKAKFASFLVENFVPYDVDVSAASCGDGTANDKEAKDLLIRRVAARGVLMNCANAIRLQVSCQPANSFLPNFLNAHPKWDDFVPLLTAATDVQMKVGMGIAVATEGRGAVNAAAAQERASLQILLESKFHEENASSDGGSESLTSSNFAKSLGFYEEGEWSFNGPSGSSGGGTSAGHLHGGSPHEDRSLTRRHSFEEGFGVFSHDFMEDPELPIVDEIDMVMHAHGHNSSHGSHSGNLGGPGTPPYSPSNSGKSEDLGSAAADALIGGLDDIDRVLPSPPEGSGNRKRRDSRGVMVSSSVSTLADDSGGDATLPPSARED